MIGVFAVLALGWADESVLDDEVFRFCHEYRAFEYNEAFCDLIDRVEPERCPGLHEYCAEPEAAPAVGCNPDRSGFGELTSNPYDGGLTPEPEEMTNPLDCSRESADGATALFSWVVAMFVALLLVAVALFVLRFVGFKRSVTPPAATRRVVEEEEGQSFAEVVDDVPDLPSRDLLASARKALDEGRLGEATLLARGAVLRELGERRVLRLHRARTDLEYVRQTDGETRAMLHQVLAMAEQHRWGRVPLQTEPVKNALQVAARLLAVLLVFVLVGSEAQAVDRHGPAGDVAFARLLEKTGAAEVRFRGQAFSELDPDDEAIDLLVIDQSALALQEEDWEAVRAWVESGHVLWVTGASDAFPELGDLDRTEGVAAVPGLTTPVFGFPPNGFAGGVPVVGDGSHHAVAWSWVGEGVVVGFGDMTMFWNGFLVHPDNEAFIGGLIGHGVELGWPLEAPVVVELGTLGASEPPTPPTAVANLRLLPFVLQVIWLWIVVVLWKGWAFRKPRDDDDRERHGFGEHIAAVAAQYERVGADTHVEQASARWVLQAHGRDGVLSAARRLGHDRDEAAAVLARITAIAEGGPVHEEDREVLWTLIDS